jgi:hypothetical protein
MRLLGADFHPDHDLHAPSSQWRALTQIELLDKQVAEPLSKAELADSAPIEDGLTLPKEIARRQHRLEQLRAASALIKKRVKERYRQELSQFYAQGAETGRGSQEDGQKVWRAPPATTSERPSGQGTIQFHQPGKPDREYFGRFWTKLQSASRRGD